MLENLSYVSQGEILTEDTLFYCETLQIQIGRNQMVDNSASDWFTDSAGMKMHCISITIIITLSSPLSHFVVINSTSSLVLYLPLSLTL